MSLIGNACTVKNVMLKWNASIMDHSYISHILLMEHAHAGPKSLVAQSLLGPDVHVSAGEVHASVIGPNTNAHHQSLVIGVLWLLGRGNVGYGANVGSNHTGRLPDQETCSGEGIFWGLSCEFPVDLSYSPYSI
jgi:bifunctional N-acetylglucosamine-1-phosphate-uridyltransferase/glucosamine-1-phosphate-acetyltransferase GlmU-like protein